MKKVLILCTGNSCRSIIAEGMINSRFSNIKAFSSGVKASGSVNPNAKKILEINNSWRDEYHSKTIETILNNDFDLIITVCDNAQENCPIFPKPIPIVHIGFEDPDGQSWEKFEQLWIDMEKRILPQIKILASENG